MLNSLANDFVICNEIGDVFIGNFHNKNILLRAIIKYASLQLFSHSIRSFFFFLDVDIFIRNINRNTITTDLLNNSNDSQTIQSLLYQISYRLVSYSRNSTTQVRVPSNAEC